MITIGGYWLISLMLTGVALGWAWFHYRQRQAPPWLSRLLVVWLMLRFAIPLVTMGTDLLSQKFLAADYAASQLMIDASSGEVAKLNPPVPANAESQGILQTMKGWVLQTGDLKQRLENWKAAVERQIEHIIKISVIFLLQTTVIPFLLLWAMYSITRSALELPRRMVKM